MELPATGSQGQMLGGINQPADSFLSQAQHQ